MLETIADKLKDLDTQSRYDALVSLKLYVQKQINSIEDCVLGDLQD